MDIRYFLLLLPYILAGCSSQETKTYKKNLSGAYIFRCCDEHFFTPPPAQRRFRDPYPWETKYIHGLPTITKEFFRCKGNPIQPPTLLAREGKDTLYYRDCEGGRKHGLPLKNGKEFVYPCLIEILNYLQQKTGKRVVITCGHRCPKHNTYADYSPSNYGSKHMLGAEVDFYIEGMEEEPSTVIELIQQYYAEKFQDPAFKNFQRYNKDGLNVSIPPWHNKEIFLKLHLAHEGRDIDNQHGFPYLTLQVRFDREKNVPVTFDAAQAQNYLRH